MGPKAVIRAMDTDFGVTPEEVESYVELLEADNGHVPADEKEAWLVIANFGPTCDITVQIPAESGLPPQTLTLRVPEKDFIAHLLGD